MKYKLPDGSAVFVQLKGDENFKWAMSEDGFILLYDSKGKLSYAMLDSLNEIVPSLWQLSSIEKRSEALSAFLLTTPKKSTPFANNELKKAIQSQQNARSELAKEPVIGIRKALIILMNFKDVKFTKDKEEFNALFNRIGYVVDGAQGSVRDYYMECSDGQLDLNSDIVGPYTADYDMSYYGGNGLKGGSDNNPEALFREAIQAASSEVNFSDYDENRDGYVDNIHIVFAGYGEEAGASSSAIWSHESTLYPDITQQGMKINSYSCAPELRENSGKGISRIGVHCHEMGHALGAMDFYDTDGSEGGEYEGTGQWDVMASGSWNEDGISPANFNPYIRAYTFGWTEAITPNKVESYPVSLGNDEVYRLDTSTPGEFFLFENRQQTGFDRALPGHGLMIYRIHSQLAGELETNTLNTTNPQMCYPVCASSSFAFPSSSPSSYGDINSAGCAFPGTSKNSVFTDETIPSAQSWNGEDSNFELTDIVENEAGEIYLKIDWNNQGDSNEHIFSENFETGFFSSVYWENAQTKVLQRWKICSKADYGDDSPITSFGGLLAKPIDGEHYMYLRTSGLKTGNVSAAATIQNIGLNVGQSASLSFIYQNISAPKQTSSILKVYAQENDTEEKILLATLSANINEWTSYVLSLPNISESGKIIFEGDVSAGDIYVDDIKIYKSSIPTQARSLAFIPPILRCWSFDGGIIVSSKTSQPLEIYTIDGRLTRKLMIQSGETRIPLPRGFYIVLVKDYRYKVVV